MNIDEYAVQIYCDVLSGSLKRFPRDFWKHDEENNLMASAAITRYLIEHILKWNDEQVKKDLSCKLFFKYKLKGMLWTLFDERVFAALDNAYPGKFKEWEVAYTPRNFWTMETARQATVWLFREKLNYTDEMILQNITRKIFVDNGLDTMMHVLFNNNASKAVRNAFPELFNDKSPT